MTLILDAILYCTCSTYPRHPVLQPGCTLRLCPQSGRPLGRPATDILVYLSTPRHKVSDVAWNHWHEE